MIEAPSTQNLVQHEKYNMKPNSFGDVKTAADRMPQKKDKPNPALYGDVKTAKERLSKKKKDLASKVK